VNTVLLRAAHRDANGVRRWTIPGASNQARLLPASLSQWPAPSFSWPHGDVVRGVRLDWHRNIAKAAARELIAAFEAAQGEQVAP